MIPRLQMPAAGLLKTRQIRPAERYGPPDSYCRARCLRYHTAAAEFRPRNADPLR